MDDLFQIIIYILIAVSFFSSFFKKKKKVQPPTDEPAERVSDHQAAQRIEPNFSKEEKAGEIDILKEFENFFSLNEPTALQKNKPVVKHDDKNIFEGAKNRENYKQVPEKSFHRRTASEHVATNTWEEKQKKLKERKQKITDEVEKKASAYQKNLVEKETAASEILGNFRKRIGNPASLKEFIIISEIIGKPKALRG